MLRLPGNKSNSPAGWTVQAKLSIYLWLGLIQNRQFSYSGLPKGYESSPEIRNAERPGALAPSNIHYLEKHVSLRTGMKQSELINLMSYIIIINHFSQQFTDISTSCSYLSSKISDRFGCVWFE